jgi:hypothetical protein
VVGLIVSACSWGDYTSAFCGDCDRVDGGAEGGDGGTWCQQQTPTLFCDDFDDGLPLGQHWSSQSTTGVAEAGLDHAQAQSPPNSFLARIAPTDGGASPVARLSKALGAVSHVSCAFDLWFDRIGSFGLLALHYYGTSLPQAIIEVRIYNDNTGDLAASWNYASGAQRVIIGAPPTGRWVKMVVDADFRKEVTLTVEGTRVALVPLPAETDAIVSMEIGPSMYGTVWDPLNVRIDNVRCEPLP